MSRRWATDCRSALDLSSLACPLSESAAVPEHPYSGFMNIFSSTQFNDQTSEHTQPRVPIRQPVYHTPPAVDDMAWDLHEVVDELSKFHLQHLLILRSMLRRPPCFEVPRQSCHHHVCPVAHQIVNWCSKRAHAVRKLFDQILLIATSVA